MSSRCFMAIMGMTVALCPICVLSAPLKKPISSRYGVPVDVFEYGASPSASPRQNVRAINAALAAKHFVRITRPGVYVLNDHLIIYPHTKLICSPGVTIRQTATVCIIRNAHMLATPPDSDITIEGGIWDGNYTGVSSADQLAPTDLTNPLLGVDGEIDAIGVNHFMIRNVLIQHCRSFGVQLSRGSDAVFENIRLDIAKDGLHINGPAARLQIAHIKGYTGDDFIALNAWDWKQSSPTVGDITDVQISDITQLPQSPTIPSNVCQYGLIKFLPGTRDGQPANIKRVTINGVHGVNSYRAFTFLADRDPSDGKPSGPGIVQDITFNHVSVKTVNSQLFWLGQNIANLSISDLTIDPASNGPQFFVPEGSTTQNLSIDGLRMSQPLENLFDVNGTISTLSISDAHLVGTLTSDFTTHGSGKIRRMILNRVIFTSSPL